MVESAGERKMVQALNAAVPSPTSLALEPTLLAPIDQLDLQSRVSYPRSGRGNEDDLSGHFIHSELVSRSAVRF